MISRRSAQTNAFSRDCWWKNLQPRKTRFWCIAATTSRTGPDQTGGSPEKSSVADTSVPNTVSITAIWTSPETHHLKQMHTSYFVSLTIPKFLCNCFIYMRFLFFIVLFFHIVERTVFVQWLCENCALLCRLSVNKSEPLHWLKTWNSNKEYLPE